MASKFLLALSLSLLVSSAFGERRPLQLSQGQQCRLQRISGVQPNRRIQSEGGVTELWDEKDDQFQCAGVAAVRNILKPNGLSLPNYQPTPRVIYIERGRGYLGIHSPGCPETYDAYKIQYTGEATEAWMQKQKGSVRDLHQKVHRIRAGDFVAIPPGSAHWTYNDGNEDLVAVSINDLNHQSNQLDQKYRTFYLAGQVPRSGQEQEAKETFQNIIGALDTNLMAEAFNVPEEIVRKMQTEQKERGLSVIVREPMSFIRPDEQVEQGWERSQSDNGLEESFCAMKISAHTDNRKEADDYTREAGKVTLVDAEKLPILGKMDLSAERGNLNPNAYLTANWAMQGHTITYVTRGDALLQVTDESGKSLMNKRVSQGDIYVVPQDYISVAKAGQNGFEWVAFMTSGTPTRSALAGYTSVMRAMPLQVLTNAYQISPRQAQEIKINRGTQSFMLSPVRPF